MYRRNDGAEPLSTYQQRLQEVYMPPEFSNTNMEPTLAGDVFRYVNQMSLPICQKKRNSNLDILQLLNHLAGDCHSQRPRSSRSPPLGHMTSQWPCAELCLWWIPTGKLFVSGRGVKCGEHMVSSSAWAHLLQGRQHLSLSSWLCGGVFVWHLLYIRNLM